MPVSVAAAISTTVSMESEAVQSRIPARTEAHAELRSALYAGIIAAALSMIQPASFILALPLGGFLSVLLHRRRSMYEDPGPLTGFRLGAFTGLFAFGLLVVLTAMTTLAFHDQAKIHADMVQRIQHAQARSVNPEVKQVADYLLTPQGMALMMIFDFVFVGILCVLLSGIGGAISGLLLRRKGPPQP